MRLEGRELADRLEFPEGPIAMPDGSVLVTEIAGGRLTRIQPSGEIEVVADLGGGPNGAAMGPDGNCYVCNNGGFSWYRSETGYLRPTGIAQDYRGGRIEQVDMATGQARALYERCGDVPLKGPNDIVFDRSGGFWSLALEADGSICVATLVRGGGSVIAPDGALVEFHEAPEPYCTNICFGGEDMKTAYVTLSGTGRLIALEWPRPGLVLDV